MTTMTTDRLNIIELKTKDQLVGTILYSSFIWKTCPACGEGKRPKRILCHNCWSALRHKPKITGQSPTASTLFACLKELGALAIYLPA